MSLVIGEKGKKYGLQKLSVFKNDDEDGPQDVNALLREANEKKAKKQSQLQQSKVLAEDPSAYDYDSVYEAMHQARQPPAPSTTSNQQKQSKYIGALKEKAAIRKVELGIAHDRKAQKERKVEGEMFAGKEKFMTTAYKQKLKEDQAFLEEEARKAALEEDVTKKEDLTSFYTSLLTKNEAYGGGRRPSPPPLVSKDKEGNKTNGDGKKEKDRDSGDREYDRDRRDRDKDHGRDRDDRDHRDRDYKRDDRIRSRSRERERNRKDRRESPSPGERKRDDRDRDNRSDKKEDTSSVNNTEAENGKEGKRPLDSEKNDEIPKKIPRRNDEASIQAARERYLKRKGLL